jgi:hypothetical protein
MISLCSCRIVACVSLALFLYSAHILIGQSRSLPPQLDSAASFARHGSLHTSASARTSTSARGRRGRALDSDRCAHTDGAVFATDNHGRMCERAELGGDGCCVSALETVRSLNQGVDRRRLSPPPRPLESFGRLHQRICVFARPHPSRATRCRAHHASTNAAPRTSDA